MSPNISSRPVAAEPSDEQLLRAVVAGDESAFRILYRRHSPRLRALIGRMLGWNDADTEDALQETWVRAMTRISAFAHGSAPGTWLSGIAINVCWERVRQKRRDSASDATDEELIAHTVLNVERMDLEQALAKLPDVHRVVVVLHDVEGYTHTEIAAQLGVAEGTSRSHLFRARKALRSMLGSYARVPE